MTCPDCGFKRGFDLYTKMHYFNMSPEESHRKNYTHTTCQKCGHNYNKYRRNTT